MIDQEELKRLLHYDPDTGVFTWKVRTTNGVKVGDVAGKKDKSKYTYIGINKKAYLAHRLAWLYMTGEWPKNSLDHINGVYSDNKWENLREATYSQNNFNKTSYKNSSSKYKGVSYHKRKNKWAARVTVNKQSNFLGYFDSEEEAALAYNKQAIKLHGEYAKLNEV